MLGRIVGAIMDRRKHRKTNNHKQISAENLFFLCRFVL